MQHKAQGDVCEHFDLLNREYLEHYHTERPHQAMDNTPLIPAATANSERGELIAFERLGGVLRHYIRVAA